ncbi:hypothetical protein ACVRXQ_12950 [Streptococcus panodentis]|uniref:LXG domain-containing protein n=1 Tax=Streptococcus panodentis TaxID=1581472 RepID=A0ABS5B2H9_9STRE|nr:hypothetical protein [Streptococcus panodentis]MBP2622159.1 hypothetical protein [Streptococcus panodentis]
MAIVKFLTKSGLSTHGESAITSSANYKDGIEGAHHTLTIKTNGSHSEAIKAFENKMNTIAQKIFVRYPELLTKYGTIIDTYVKAVEGAGFTSDILRTQKTPIKHVKKWLDETTVDRFEKLHKALDPQLEAARDALKMDPEPESVDEGEINTRSELASAKGELQTLGQARMDTHMKLENALQTFKADLKSFTSELSIVSQALNNARFMSGLPASDVEAMIISGQLRADNIDELDAIQDRGDGAALKVLLGEGTDKKQFFTDLGSVDTSNVSSVMMYKIYLRTHAEEVRAEDENDFTNIEAMAIAISNQHHDKAQAYTEKMAIAGDRYAELIGNRARALNPELQGNDIATYERQLDENAPLLAALDKDLKSAGRLVHLFEAMHVNHVGRDRNINPADKKNPIYETRTIKQGSLSLVNENKDDIYRFTLSVKGGNLQKELSVISNRQENATTLELSELSEEYRKLDEKRLKAGVDFALDMATLGAGSQYAFMINTIRNSDVLFGEKSTMEQRFSSIIKQDAVNKGQFGSSYSDLLGKWPRGISNTGVIVSKLNEIQKNADEIKKKTNQKLFNIGGYTISDYNHGFGDLGSKKENKTVLFRPQYDLQAILQMDDLEKNGVRTYVYHTNGNNGAEALEKFDQAMSQYKPGSPYRNDVSKFFGIKDSDDKLAPITSDMRDFLTGKGGMENQNMVNFFKSMEIIQEEKDNGKNPFGLERKVFSAGDYITDRNEFYDKLLEGNKTGDQP